MITRENDTTDEDKKQDGIKTKKTLKEKRVKADYVGARLAKLGFKGQARRVRMCATMVDWVLCENGHRYPANAHICTVRLCPVTAWRRSRMCFGQIIQVLHVADKQEPLRYLFLTLTIRNVEGDKLGDAISEMYKGWNELHHKKRPWFKNVRGYIKNLEITRNMDINDPWYGTYHPHIHVLLAVQPDYFKKGYISRKEWISAWQICCNLAYDPQVKINAIYNKHDPQDRSAGSMLGAAAETAKYSVKDSEMTTGDIEWDDETILTYIKALNKRRLLEFGGIFKQIHHELHLVDTETGDLDIKCDDVKGCKICGSKLVMELELWNFSLQDYILLP